MNELLRPSYGDPKLQRSAQRYLVYHLARVDIDDELSRRKTVVFDNLYRGAARVVELALGFDLIMSMSSDDGLAVMPTRDAIDSQLPHLAQIILSE